MKRKSISTLGVACSIIAGLSALHSMPARAQVGRAAAQSTMTAPQFAKCAATYDFLIDILKAARSNGSLQQSEYNRMMPTFIANRSLLGAKFFSQKNAPNAAQINSMIGREKVNMSLKTIDGPLSTKALLAEGDKCYYNFLR